MTEAKRTGLRRHKDFLKLWSGETLSLLGSAVTLLALPVVAIRLLGAGPTEMGFLTALEMSPFLLIGLPAGVWVDRLRRRPILIVADIGRAAAIGSVPVAHALGMLTMAQLFVVALITGVFTVFFDVAYQSFLPSLVTKDELVEGNSKLEMSRSAAQIGGPGLAGLLIALVGAPGALVVDGASFVASVLFLLAIHTRELRPRPKADRPGMRREMAEGLRYVLGHRTLRRIAACTGTSNLFSFVAQAVFFLFLLEELDLSEGLVGAIFMAGNAGALLGAAISMRISRKFGVGPTIVGSIVLCQAGTYLIPLATTAAAIPVLTASFLVTFFANPIYNITQVSLRQAITPERLQGRMNATMRFIVWGTMPFGAVVGGLLGTSIGIRPTLWVAAIGGSLAVLPVLGSAVRGLRVIPETADVEVSVPPELVTAPGLVGTDSNRPATDDAARNQAT